MAKVLTAKVFLFCYFSFHLMESGPTRARPCVPTDPDGENPGNLCLHFPTHGMSLNSNAFRQGYASDGFYGTPTGPTQPGIPIQVGHIPGTKLDPVKANSRSGGYWTSIEASNGTSKLRTSTGKEWTMMVPSP